MPSKDFVFKVSIQDSTDEQAGRVLKELKDLAQSANRQIQGSVEVSQEIASEEPVKFSKGGEQDG